MPEITYTTEVDGHVYKFPGKPWMGQHVCLADHSNTICVVRKIDGGKVEVQPVREFATQLVFSHTPSKP